MKIYFACSIRGGRAGAAIYLKIIDCLKNYGQVLTEHFGDQGLSSQGEELDPKFIHDRDLNWVMEAEVIVAEVSTPSLGVGYEIGRAIEHGKKILCLYRPQTDKRLSSMIAGCDQLTVAEYNNFEEIKKAIAEFFK